MGSSLKSAVGHYNSTVSSLESRFIPQAKKLYALGAAYTKNIVPEVEQIEIAVRQLDPPEEKAGE
jgi:DNA recombination protein RmuC